MRHELLPQFYERFRAALPAFWRLNSDLARTLASRARWAAELQAFPRPVSIVFGADDPYLTVHVARWFARLFPQADLRLVRGARHYIQVDEPKLVATAVLAAGRRDRATSPAPP